MKCNRVGVMVLFAEEGVIDSADLYLAKSISEVVKDLYIVINGSPLEHAVSLIKNISENVYVRENIGYDCGAYKYALENVIGWDTIRKYDELLLINDSCYGPIYPWKDVFEEMADKPYDFWGITESPEIKRGRFTEAMIPYHVQSYFIVIRNKLLKSSDFSRFWESIKLSNAYEQVVNNFELTFSQHFNHLGYTSGAYIDSQAFCSSIEETQAYIFFDSYRLVSEYRCPLIKKKVFLFPKEFVLASNAGETARKTLDYIEKETAYDADMIWEHLIRKSDVLELKDTLHLDYICSKEIEETSECIQPNDIAVIINLHSCNSIDKCCHYAEKINSIIKVYIILDSGWNTDVKKKLTNKTNIEIIEKDAEHSISYHELYQYIERKYEYVCIIDDTERIPAAEASESYTNVLWENSVGNEIFIKNVWNLFKENPRLGFLTVPLSYMADFFVKNLGYNEKDKPVLRTANAFWCRTCILEPLETLSDNHSNQNCWFQDVPYWAKDRGYYSGQIMTEEYASLYITNYQYMLHGIIKNVLLGQGVEEFRSLFKINEKVLQFARNFKKIYIYGAGEGGYHCINYLEENGLTAAGFIVSDGLRYNEEFLNYPVYELSEIDLFDDIGIIVALNKRNASEVMGNFENTGFNNIIIFSE